MSGESSSTTMADADVATITLQTGEENVHEEKDLKQQQQDVQVQVQEHGLEEQCTILKTQEMDDTQQPKPSTAMLEEKDESTTPTNNDNNTTTTTRTAGSSSVLPSWDYSDRKVLVHGVLKFNDVRAMKKMIDRWLEKDLPNVQYEKVKKPPKETWMVITVKDSTMVRPLVDYINNNEIRTKKGNVLFAKLVNSNNDRNDNNNEDSRNKRKSHNSSDNGSTDNNNNIDSRSNDQYTSNSKNKRQRRGDNNEDGGSTTNRHEDILASSTTTTTNSTDIIIARRPVSDDEIKDKVIPYWRLTISEQQDAKTKDMIKKCAMKIMNELKSKFRMLNKDKNRSDRKVNLYRWIGEKRGIFINPIVSAPTPLRNKSEFTFGYRYLFDDVVTEKNTDENNTNRSEVEEVMEQDDSANGKTGEAGHGITTEAVKKNGGSGEPKRVPACGFMVTGWAGGVCRPHGCTNIPAEQCAIVDLIDGFLQQSKLPVYDSKSHKGFWRLLTIRTSRRTLECMIIIQHTPANVGGEGDNIENADGLYSKDFEIEKPKLIELLTHAELNVPNQQQQDQQDVPSTAIMKVTSIFFQEFGGLSSPPPEHPVQHAYGKTCLTERLGKCVFEISPGAFFQVNTEGAEILYQLAVDKVKEVSKPDDANNTTLLFDVCCGTGTIGLTCLKEGVVDQVIGVDMSEPGIRNAQKNAELNGFGDNDVQEDALDNTEVVEEIKKKKTRFVAARAEQVLGREISAAKKESYKTSQGMTTTFVAVVDPAREGLHADVVKTIRGNEQIKRLVYVSCNPTGSMVNDASLLCCPPTKRYAGRPFKITSATPVDMFPLTNHCEMVMTFDRLDDDEMK